jgi:hypothetical protein
MTGPTSIRSRDPAADPLPHPEGVRGGRMFQRRRLKGVARAEVANRRER